MPSTQTTMEERFAYRFNCKTWLTEEDKANCFDLGPTVSAALKVFIRSEISLAVAGERERYAEIFAWLLGEGGDFPDLSQKPHYSFRTELRKKLSTLTP